MYRTVNVNKDSLLYTPGGHKDRSDINGSDEDVSEATSEARLTNASGDKSHEGCKGKIRDRNTPAFVNGGPNRVQDTSSLQHYVQREIHFREISPHIKKLILDFVFPHVTNQENEEELIALEDVEITLEALMSQPFIEELKHGGILYQQTLDQITNIPTLKVWPRLGPCSLRSLAMPDIRPHPQLTFVKLRHMHLLKVLHVSQLLASEGPGLGQAVRSLSNIEELYVGASSFNDALPSFLESFFIPNKAYTGSPPPSPVSSLKSFSLVDCYHMVFLSTIPLFDLKPLATLQSLYFDVPLSEAFMILFLEATSTHNLTNLTISVDPSRSGQTLSRSLQLILNRHHFTLHTLTFLNAWRNDFDRKRDILEHLVPWMHSWQLYLSRPQWPPSRNPEIFSYDDDDDFDTLKWRIFGYVSQPYMWGYRMRHLRIDQIDIRHLQVNKIDEDFNGLLQLKVLVLRPLAEQVVFEAFGVGSRSLPYPFEPFGPDLPSDMNTLRETQIAQEIAAQELPSLRIIVVSRYKYWVQGKQRGTNSRNVCFLRRALEDPKQEAEIMRIIDRDDWNFLADRSICLPEVAFVEQLNKANRVVYRNEDVARGLQSPDV